MCRHAAPPPPPPPLFGLHLGRAGSKADPGLCTVGLGSESSGDLDLDDIVAADDVQDCMMQQQQDDQEEEEMLVPPVRKRVFRPPILVICAAGKPWQYLRAQRGAAGATGG
ncbi:hypothetical protein ZWY2020_051881 [Hordeum vulgare]|nr:hypothetical protein ZWY2020_051881 [Hordeum vulgare]